MLAEIKKNRGRFTKLYSLNQEQRKKEFKKKLISRVFMKEKTLIFLTTLSSSFEIKKINDNLSVRSHLLFEVYQEEREILKFQRINLRMNHL